MTPVYILPGDNRRSIQRLLDMGTRVHAIVTDPPYGLTSIVKRFGGKDAAPAKQGTDGAFSRASRGFMGKVWDGSGIERDPEFWRLCWELLLPGGHVLAFSGTRTQHRMVCAIEDAGFEIRDMIAWVYAQGFPKSLDVGKALDKHGGQSVAWFGPWFRQWRQDNGISQNQVAALFPSKAGNLTSCVANWELGINMPTTRQFNLIRDTFGLPFDSIAAAEREVVGSDTKARSTAGKSALPTMGAGVKYETWDLTAPATDLARQWDGWGTALKPALEPIILARKPLVGTVASNVAEYGVGAVNVGGCRVGTTVETWPTSHSYARRDTGAPSKGTQKTGKAPAGRHPANLLHDGSPEVVGLFPDSKGMQGDVKGSEPSAPTKHAYGKYTRIATPKRDDTGGSAARFFNAFPDEPDPEAMLFHRKAGRQDRDGSTHPTVKPVGLLRHLIRLITPPGGVVLDPFGGSGTTGEAARLEGKACILMEAEEEYVRFLFQRFAKRPVPRASPKPARKPRPAAGGDQPLLL